MTEMDTASIHSAPSSVSISSARSTPVPSHYKPLTQSASVLALTKSPDSEIKKRNPDELVHMLRRLEAENRNLVTEHGNIMKDMNKKTQILLLEVRGLKDINQTLQDDNQELRDLCCFLDDDRQRGRKLAREWQRFGRYTASVMRSEVSAYQEKLKELEQKQQELISDNVDLKELCLYLDQERMRAGQTRDEGDGSSNSTIAGNEEPAMETDGIDLVPVSQLHNNNTGTKEYVRHLEDKVKQLEAEKKNISQKLAAGSSGGTPSSPNENPQVLGNRRLGPDGNPSQDGSANSSNPNKPEAVVHAMKVLEVHENLERPITSVGEDNLDDKEKAIVREMCNVVWRKLGNVSSEGDSETSTPHPVYENIQPARSRSTPPDPAAQPGPDRPPDRYQPHTFLSQDPGIGLEPMPVYTAQPVQPMPQLQRSDPNLHQGKSSQFSRSDVRQSGQYQGQYTSASQHQSQNTQSERPPPNQGFQGGDSQHAPPPPPNPHYASQAPKYGYIRTTRSTPVTPTPQQRSYSPLPSHVQSGQRQYDRSASPGPGHKSNVQRSHSPEPQRSQHPRTDSQSSVHLYQNHPPMSNKGDNSYENIPHNYYYVTSSKGSKPMQDTTQGMRGAGSDYTRGPVERSVPQIPHNEQSNPNTRHQSRGKNQPPQPQSSAAAHHQYPSQTPPYYQNMQFQNAPSHGKQNFRDPSPQGPRSQPSQAPPYRPPQQPGQQYSQQYQSRPVSVSSTSGLPPPSQTGPPQYMGHQMAYTDYQGEGHGPPYSNRQEGRGRRDQNQYYQ